MCTVGCVSVGSIFWVRGVKEPGRRDSAWRATARLVFAHRSIHPLQHKCGGAPANVLYNFFIIKPPGRILPLAVALTIAPPQADKGWEDGVGLRGEGVATVTRPRKVLGRKRRFLGVWPFNEAEIPTQGGLGPLLARRAGFLRIRVVTLAAAGCRLRDQCLPDMPRAMTFQKRLSYGVCARTGPSLPGPRGGCLRVCRALLLRRCQKNRAHYLPHFTRVCLLRALLLRHVQRLSAAAHHQRGQVAGSHLLSRGANACASSLASLPRAAPYGLAFGWLC